MAHFAKIVDGIVKDVIVVKNEDAASEAEGQAFIASLGFDGVWLQTSYNRNIRGRFAGIGMSYNEELDCFHSDSPYPSWSLKPDGEWHAPVDKPDDGESWGWDEENQAWILIES